MQRLAIQFCVSLVTFIIGIAAAGFGTSSSPGFLSSYSAEKEILKVEREYIRAHTERDTAALDQILADDFTFTYRCGKVSDKAGRLALVDNPGFSFISITTDDVEVNVVGDRGFVRGQAVVRTRDIYHEFTSRPYRYIRVFEKRDGRWQVVSTQIMSVSWD
jgi:ketosteroid isomerase-like protein